MPHGQVEMRGSAVNDGEGWCNQGLCQTGYQPKQNGNSAEDKDGQEQAQRGCSGVVLRVWLRRRDRLAEKGAVKEKKGIQKGEATRPDRQDGQHRSRFKDGLVE